MKAPCVVCGKEVDRWPAHLARNTKGVFCSHACHGEWQRGANNHAYQGGKVPCTCAHCGKALALKAEHFRRSTLHFCSRACQGAYCSGGNHPRTLALKAPCLECGAVVKIKSRQIGKRVFCSRACASRAHRAYIKGPANPRYVDGMAEERYSAAFRALAPRIRERDRQRCRLCHRTREDNGKELDVHHIDYDKDNNAAANLITLCPRCHGAMHGSPRSRAKWQAELSSL